MGNEAGDSLGTQLHRLGTATAASLALLCSLFTERSLLLPPQPALALWPRSDRQSVCLSVHAPAAGAHQRTRDSDLQVSKFPGAHRPPKLLPPRHHFAHE